LTISASVELFGRASVLQNGMMRQCTGETKAAKIIKKTTTATKKVKMHTKVNIKH
jgi:hypothetical protein